MIKIFTADTDSVLAEASQIFDSMIPDMAYVDAPTKPMADSVFFCNSMLALYLALKPLKVDVHDFGKAMLGELEITIKEMRSSKDENANEQAEKPSAQEQFAGFIAAGEKSQEEAIPGEFIFEAFTGAGKEYNWGMNIKSCAICHSFAKYDAMDLVPYMCATDDVTSDISGQGLARTGSIAVGAHQCDFRYTNGGEPVRLAEQYPERIRIVE